jgi:hypothetical protein
MAFVLADVGADLVLGTFFVATAVQNTKLKLFATNVTPSDADVVGTYTEASGGGYAAKTLTRGTWVLTVGHDPSDVVYADQVFTFTGALTTNGTIYGHYITDNAGTVLLGAEKLTTPYTPAVNGDTLTIGMTLKLSKGTAS